MCMHDRNPQTFLPPPFPPPSVCQTSCERVGEAFHPVTVINAAWLHFVTMTTIGYGEYSVNTHAGRFLVVLSWAFGLIVNSFVLSGFIQALAITRSERFLLEKLDHKHIQKMRHNDAAALITHFIKYWIIVSKLNHTFLSAKERLIVERYEKLSGQVRRRSTISKQAEEKIARKMSRKESNSSRLNSERDVDKMSDEQIMIEGKKITEQEGFYRVHLAIELRRAVVTTTP